MKGVYRAWSSGLLATLLLAGGAAVAVAETPNVLLVIVDDLTAEWRPAGEPPIELPNFERVAERGLRFNRAYCQSPGCNPSRTSMLTGLRPGQTGIVTNRRFFRDVIPGVVTLPELFRANGYFTAGIGKVFHGAGTKGWDDPRSWDLDLLPSSRRAANKGKGRNLTDGELQWARWRSHTGRDRDQADGATATAARVFLRQAGEQPFFLPVGFHKPHPPFVAPRAYFRRYRLRSFGGDEAGPPGFPAVALNAATRAIFDRFGRRDRREFLRAYYAATTYMDAQLGRILDVVDQRDLWSDTVVVVTSDHGFHLGQHGWWGKSTLFEPSARVPLIIAAPEMSRSGRRTNALVELVDLFPTLTGIASLANPVELPGRDLSPLLEGPDGGSIEGAFTEFWRDQTVGRSVRTERWRYTEWDAEPPARELYDHSADPGETVNLADDPEHQEVVDRLSRLLSDNAAVL